jgi:cytochrome c-type biogenesis protein CcmH
MVERYGDFVLYNPPFKLSTALLWIGPGVLFVAALVWLFMALARRRREVAEQRPLTEEEKKRAEALLSGAGFEETARGRKA